MMFGELAAIYTVEIGAPSFSRNANGVRAIHGVPASAPTPLALGLNDSV